MGSQVDEFSNLVTNLQKSLTSAVSCFALIVKEFKIISK